MAEIRNARRGWGRGLVPGLKEREIVEVADFGMSKILDGVGNLVLRRRKEFFRRGRRIRARCGGFGIEGVLSGKATHAMPVFFLRGPEGLGVVF